MAEVDLAMAFPEIRSRWTTTGASAMMLVVRYQDRRLRSATDSVILHTKPIRRRVAGARRSGREVL